MKLLILGLGGQEVLVVALLALLLFGGKKIPELMSGVGRGVKNFRDAMAGNLPEEDKGKEGKDGKKEEGGKDGDTPASATRG